MADTSDQDQIKDELRSARADLHADFAELDHQLHVDLPAIIRANAPAVVGAAGAVGLILGLAGPKAIARIIAIGIPIAIAAAYVQRQRSR